MSLRTMFRGRIGFLSLMFIGKGARLRVQLISWSVGPLVIEGTREMPCK